MVSGCCVTLALALSLGSWPSAATAQIVGPLAWQSPVLVDPPHPEPSTNPSLGAISCPSESLCVATDGPGDIVTSKHPGDGAGAWQVTHVDSNRTCERSMCPASFTAISCPATSLCVALDTAGYVFWSTEPSGGAAWSTAKISGEYGLKAVSCPSVSLCVAVGIEGDLIASTDPTGGAAAWHTATVDTGPCPAAECQSRGEGTFPLMEAISCPSTSLCVAGDWNGNVLSSADPAAGAGAWSVAFVDHNMTYGGTGREVPAEIRSVACPSVTECIASDAIGEVLASQDPTARPSAWTATRALPQSIGRLTDLACPSTLRCIGLNENASEIYLTESPLTGGPWTQVANDSAAACTPFLCSAGLNGLSCPSDLLCVADDQGGHVVVGRAQPLGRAAVQSLVRAELTPRGRASRIGALLRTRAFAGSFNAPSAGSVRIRWSLSPRHKRKGKGNHGGAGLTIAHGQGTFSAGATGLVQLALTRSGAALLRHRNHAPLVVEAVFTPPNERPIRAVRRFILKR